MAKSVRVHEDTHHTLMLLKVSRRSQSLDEVIREMIIATTGKSLEQVRSGSKEEELTRFLAT